jgi:hypothetical protein
MNVAGIVSSLHWTPTHPCPRIPFPIQSSFSIILFCCELVHGWGSSPWQLVRLEQFVSSRIGTTSPQHHALSRPFFIHVILRRVFIRAFGFPMYDRSFTACKQLSDSDWQLDSEFAAGILCKVASSQPPLCALVGRRLDRGRLSSITTTGALF